MRWLDAERRLSALRCVEALPRSAIGKVLKKELTEGVRGSDQIG